jgi:hypothetical protein
VPLVAEPIQSWWARRQFSRGERVPYAVGTYREAWAAFPVLIRQYHPELNAGITLTQIPPAAEVLLQWQCDAGHTFVATPEEQRMRPGRERRKSSWCPSCSAMARPRPVRMPEPVPEPAPGQESAPEPEAEAPFALLASAEWPPAASSPAAPRAAPARVRPAARRRAPRLCLRTPELPTGEPFVSDCAPRPASAAEGQLRAELAGRLEWTPGFNAVRLRRPFFEHLEAWPDILLPELRIAVEYDTVGRHGLEHVGHREEADRRKDRAVRAAGWEVVRIRTGRLEKLGPHDVQLSGLTRAAYPAILDEFRAIRGPFLVDAYLR